MAKMEIHESLVLETGVPLFRNVQLLVQRLLNGVVHYRPESVALKKLDIYDGMELVILAELEVPQEVADTELAKKET